MAYIQYMDPSTKQMKKIALILDSVVLGRHPLCEIVLNGSAISREHARITHLSNGYQIEDLQSRNGTQLNDRPLGERKRLYDGDTIRISDLLLTFHSDEPGDKRNDTIREVPGIDDPVLIDDLSSESHVNITSQIQLNPEQTILSKPSIEKLDFEQEVFNLQTRLRVIMELCKTLGNIGESRELLPRFLSSLLMLFPNADSLCLVGTNSKTNQLELLGYKRRNEKSKAPFKVSRTIYDSVIRNRTGILSDDLLNDSRFGKASSAMRIHSGSFMAVPIVEQSQDRVLGVVQIETGHIGVPFSRNDLELLISVSNLAALYYGNIRLQEMRVQEKMMSREVSVAHKVQQGFLPNESPDIPNYMFYDYYRPAKFIGGDYFDYVYLPEGRLAIVVGDVAGKGISAALLMAKLSAEVRYSLLLEKSLPEAMARLNRAYAGNHWENWFITFLLAVLDTNDNTVRILNAGHVLPLLSKQDGSVIDLAETVTAFPLGVTPTTEYKEFTYTLQKGESLALMSDGLTDAMNQKGEYFTLENVRHYLKNDSSLNPDQLGERLIRSVRDFVGQTHQSDDQCLVIFGRLE